VDCGIADTVNAATITIACRAIVCLIEIISTILTSDIRINGL